MTPIIYESAQEIEKNKLPLFVKPDVGQGAKGARKINDADELKEIDLKKML